MRELIKKIERMVKRSENEHTKNYVDKSDYFKGYFDGKTIALKEILTELNKFMEQTK